jgi:hypothetical protein
MDTPKVDAGRLERRVRRAGNETMPGGLLNLLFFSILRNTRSTAKPDGSCNPVRNVLLLEGVLTHTQNLSDGFIKPVAPIPHTPARFVISASYRVSFLEKIQ